MNKKTYLSIILILLLINTSIALSYEVEALPKGVSIHQLDNGMNVLLIENPALPMVGVNVVIKVGSAYENFATSGMSHMLEHLLFNGTNNRTQEQLYDDVDLIGGYNNANTSEYFTNFMMVTPAEHIRQGMEIQADMLFNSTLPPEKFTKEKGIVLEEISKSLVNPLAQLERNTLSILYKGHALSLPTLGTYSTIESMSRDDVYHFYKNYYVPNNMILSVIGNFQTDKMLAMIGEIYGTAKPGDINSEVNPEWRTVFQGLPAGMEPITHAYHRFYDGQDIKLQLFYPIPGLKSSEFYELLNLVLDKNIDETQILMKAEFPEIVKSVSMSLRRTPIVNHLSVTILLNAAEDLNAIIKSITTKLGNLNFALPEETIKTQVTKARANFLKNIEKPHMFGIFNANIFAVHGIEAVLTSYTGKEFYQGANLLKDFKIDSSPKVIIQHPYLKKEQELTVTTQTKLFQDQSTGKIVIAVQNDVSNLLAVHYLVKHKAVYESKYGKDAAKILHDCLEQRLESDENQKISNRFGLNYVVNDNPYIPMDNIYLHPDFGYIRVEGLSDDLPGVIGYLNGQLKDFVPTEEEFNKANRKFQRSNMMMMGGNEAKKVFDETYKSIIYVPSKYDTDKEELDYEKLLAFAKEYFQPSNMIISVVSPANPDSINSLFTEFFINPIIEEPSAYTESLQLQNKEVQIKKDVGGDRAFLFWGFTREIDAVDKPALKALSLILSDSIVFNIREKQGMAYNMSAGIDPVEDKALFYIQMGTRPLNVEKLLPQFSAFFKMKILEAFTDKDLEKSINMYLGRMMFRRLSSINQAYYLAHSYYFYGDIFYDTAFHEQMKKVTLKDVKQVARKYMKIENPVSIIVQ